MIKKLGFTIIEIAIVLTLVGLIIGGIVAGGAMMKTAKVNAAMSDFAKYETAAVQYREKYDFWPGDQTDASSYWTGAGNGDGDGRIWQTACGTGTTSLCNNGGVMESLYSWQVLGLSGLLDASYTGALSGGYLVPDVNAPRAPVDNTAGSTLTSPIFMFSHSPVTGKQSIFLSDFNGSTYQNALNSVDAYQIDLKLDDGIAASGNIRALELTALSCLTTSQYDTSTSSKRCIIYNSME